MCRMFKLKIKKKVFQWKAMQVVLRLGSVHSVCGKQERVHIEHYLPFSNIDNFQCP